MFMRTPLLLSIVIAVTALTGCIAPHVKAPPTSPAVAESARILGPIGFKVAFANSNDEDLRAALTAEIQKAFRQQGIEIAGSGPFVEVRVDRLRRVSKSERRWKREFAGTANFDLTLTFPTGEVITNTGSAGVNLIFGAVGHTTETALELIGQTAAAETKRRIGT